MSEVSKLIFETISGVADILGIIGTGITVATYLKIRKLKESYQREVSATRLLAGASENMAAATKKLEEFQRYADSHALPPTVALTSASTSLRLALSNVRRLALMTKVASPEKVAEIEKAIEKADGRVNRSMAHYAKQKVAIELLLTEAKNAIEQWRDEK